VTGKYRQQPRATKPRDERTKFDKWLEECIAEGQAVSFIMYDDDEIVCLPVTTDRYMVQVKLIVEGDEDEKLVWVNKGAILLAAPDDGNKRERESIDFTEGMER